MGSSVKLPCKNRVVRGTKQQLKQYCKDKNIAAKRIKKDKEGYYLKAIDRSGLHKR